VASVPVLNNEVIGGVQAFGFLFGEGSDFFAPRLDRIGMVLHQKGFPCFGNFGHGCGMGSGKEGVGFRKCQSGSFRGFGLDLNKADAYDTALELGGEPAVTPRTGKGLRDQPSFYAEPLLAASTREQETAKIKVDFRDGGTLYYSLSQTHILNGETPKTFNR